jgi:hypothetical protein
MKMPMIGLAVKLGKGKGSESENDDEPESEDDESTGSETAFAKEAFSALQDGDEAGFVSAIIGAIKACLAKDESYQDEE